ncbi:unnamed protein product [Withania somnifera]
MGNLVLFDKSNCIIWQSFDHPDSLLPGKSLVYGKKLIPSHFGIQLESRFVFSYYSQWKLGHLHRFDPPRFYYASPYTDSRSFGFDGRTFIALKHPPRPAARFIKLGHDGHLRVYQWDGLHWKEVNDILNLEEGNFFRPFNDRNPDLGCTELTSISCDSPEYHSLRELKNTAYFAFDTYLQPNSSILGLERKTWEECKRACRSNCSCKVAAFRYDQDGNERGNCLLLNEVFSLKDNGEGTKKTVFLKVQNSSNALINHSSKQKSKPLKVIIGSTFAALFGTLLILSACSLFSKRKRSRKDVDYLDLAPLLPGVLTRFSYNELKIITEDFSRKLGEGGFGSVYEGTLSNGTKIAVKHLNGIGQVDSQEKKENGLTWHTRQRIVSDIAKGLAYLHDECTHKIIHLDIKPQNILLYQNFNAKISDFGLSKLIEKDKSKVMTRMRGTPGYLAPEWLRSEITEKVDVYAFGIVLLELLCGRKNLDQSQADEDVHLLTVFRRKTEQQQLMDIVDKNNEGMQIHKKAVTEMMSLAAWCLQGDFTKRPSMTLVVKVLEGLVSVETNIDYDFTSQPEAGAGNHQREATTISSKLPSALSGPRETIFLILA